MMNKLSKECQTLQMKILKFNSIKSLDKPSTICYNKLTIKKKEENTMKYEIRIISEEDTVKSKPYEDLNKAIEIADKIFNNFANTDFGDEIIVVEENSKDKKYYWANGKILIEELKVGDIVRIIDNGYSYTTYGDFMLKYGSKEDCCYWKHNELPKQNDVLYEIICIENHSDGNEEKLAIIRSRTEYYYEQVYIMGIKGLKKVNC